MGRDKSFIPTPKTFLIFNYNPSLKRVGSPSNDSFLQCVQVYITESYTILSHCIILWLVRYRIDILSRLTAQMFSFPLLPNHLTKAPILLLKCDREVCTFCLVKDVAFLFDCVAHDKPPLLDLLDTE